MGLDFNVASSGDNQEVRKATSVCFDATESTGDTTAIQMEHRSQISSLLRRNSGEQERDSDPQTFQGVLGMIENAVYPYCSNDSSFTSSCRISSGQGDILTGTGSARATSTPITCNTSGAAEILVDFESTTCKTVENSIDETGSEFRENVEIHETAGKVENESKDMEFRDNGQLYSPSLALQPIRRQSIKEQDQKQAEPQNMTHAHRHTSPSLCQIPGLRISAATHISDSQPTQTDEKHDQACSPDRENSKFQEAVSPGYPNAQPVVKPQPNPAEQECLTLGMSHITLLSEHLSDLGSVL
ncbi:hypothetical protein QFC19_003597 [Naganishia cerealis]|uniref:Uncharacterized protein n=1 Tax=Naganishia cerealis TaxID=610337 RepID=A0ACC2W1F2_9TREE|nr:hypothetical protein QFC19_003597 [Naganishia cerealis]